MVLAGASAMISQIVLMREFLVVFHGNEISIGLILAGWLLWGAFGSSILGRFSDHAGDGFGVFSMCQLGLAFILPGTLFFIRSSRQLLGIMPGEIIGYLPMMLLTFVALCIPCAVMGFMFSLACRIYRGLAGDPAESIARVYVLEAAGALSGGLVVSYFMMRYMTSFSILFILSFFNIAASAAMQRHRRPGAWKRAAFLATVVLLALGTVMIISGGGRGIRQLSLEKLWSGFQLMGSKNSIYGNVTVTERGGQRSFYENGLHLYTVPDRLSSEESVHFALLEDKDPEDILLIGGGVGGLLAEILKYPLKRVDYVELDPLIIDMARKYLKTEDVSFLDRTEVRVINADARFFVKRTRNTYDCVIISLGDPYTAQINRFYTVDFFRELNRILKKGAVVSFALTSSENYISGELRDYLRSIYLSASEVFPEILIIPGDTAYFLLSNERGTLTLDAATLMARMKKWGIQADYVREYYLFDKLSRERIEYANNTIAGGGEISVNRDFRPIAHYYATVFWGTHFDTPFLRHLLRSVTAPNIWLAGVAFCFLALLFGLPGKKRISGPVLLAVATTGFAEINFQIAVMLSFQVIYGYVFHKLGMIITSFMLGLALGGWIAAVRMRGMKNVMSVFTWTQFGICLYPLILPIIFMWLSRSDSVVVSWLGSNVVLPMIPIVAGVIGGIQFPLANKICLAQGGRLGRVAGASYGLDLFGACIGAFLASAFLIPILGVFQTCLLAALINTTVLAMLLLRRQN